MNNELYYFRPYQVDDITYSCDMLYLKFRYNDENLHRYLQHELLQCYDDFEVNYFPSKDKYKYSHLFVVNFLKYGFKLIIKFQLQKEHVGVLEFNPNHLMLDDAFYQFYLKLINNFYSLEYYKMDFAVDLPVPRCNVKVLRDNRKYMKFVHGSVTEYLGCRNKHNHIKIYDKSYESKLSYDLTRVEITIENGQPINYPDIKILLTQPEFNLNNLTQSEQFILGMLIEVEDPYYHLRKLRKRDRLKYENLLNNQYYNFEYATASYLQVLYNIRDTFHFTI